MIDGMPLPILRLFFFLRSGPVLGALIAQNVLEMWTFDCSLRLLQFWGRLRGYLPGGSLVPLRAKKSTNAESTLIQPIFLCGTLQQPAYSRTEKTHPHVIFCMLGGLWIPKEGA